MRATIFTSPFVLAATSFALMSSAAPALASDSCATAPDALRAVAATAEPAARAKALRNVALGEQLCAARNRVDAGKKFNLAAKELGVDLATIMNQTRTAAAL